MAKFRKKPIVIEAMQYDGTLDSYSAMYFFAGDNIAWHNGSLRVNTLEGDMRASPGDWIIKGIKGELYPCKPDIFAQTYESVDEADDN